MIVGTFEAIALWAKEVIEDVGASGTVWDYNREISTNVDQFRADFATGLEKPNKTSIIRGWIIEASTVEVLSTPKVMGDNKYVHSFDVGYLFYASYEDRGANKHNITTYIETVVNALQAVARPDELDLYDVGGGNRPFVGAINWNITPSAFPDTQPNPALLVWRVEATQEIQLIQPIR